MDYGLPEQSSKLVFDTSLAININSWLIWLFGFLLFVVLVLLARKIILIWAVNSRYHDYVIYLIRLPKEKGEEKNNQAVNYLQQLREEIARGETIFKAIGGLKAQKWYHHWAWLFGRNDHFSF